MENIVSLSQLNIEDGVYSYADYLTWKFEQTVELIKGKILPLSAPSRKHQDISWRLTLQIGNYFAKHTCKAYAAPFDVRLYDKEKSLKANTAIYSVVQHDICIICDLTKLDDRGCLGSPDLVIEILSPGNSSKEMKIKKALYEENGIKEYLIFDPEHQNVFQFHLTQQDIYSPATIYVSDEVVTSVIFPELKFDLNDIFAE